jgi:hypothetical protein
MDEAADRTRAAETRTVEPPPARPEPHTPSDERFREEKQHEQAEGIAVEGDDLSEIFESALGRGRPHVGPAQPKGPWAWPPQIGHESEQAASETRPAADEPDPADEADENQCG